MDTGTIETRGRPLPIFMIPPPVLFGISFAIGVLLQYLLPLPEWNARGALKLVGVAVLACAICSGAALAVTFLARRTTLNPFAGPSLFMARGAYRFSRNPMYLALAVAYIAGIVLYGSLWPVVMLLVPLLVLDRIVIPFEERRMSATFGASYDAYKGKVHRWL